MTRSWSRQVMDQGFSTGQETTALDNFTIGWVGGPFGGATLLRCIANIQMRAYATDAVAADLGGMWWNDLYPLVAVGAEDFNTTSPLEIFGVADARITGTAGLLLDSYAAGWSGAASHGAHYQLDGELSTKGERKIAGTGVSPVVNVTVRLDDLGGVINPSVGWSVHWQAYVRALWEH